VVLAPRRWRQVRGKVPRNDGGKRARSPGRARRKPLKPLRGECRAISGVTVVTMLVCFVLFCTRGCGRIGRPAFPAPSDFRERALMAKLAWIARRDREAVLERDGCLKLNHLSERVFFTSPVGRGREHLASG
jgi:hypothetical protein